MNKEALLQHFQGRQSLDIRFSTYLPDPHTLGTLDRCTYHGGCAARYAAELRQLIETMEAYQQIVYDRVQELATAPYHTEIHLRRERRYYSENKVFYYLEAVKVYEAPGIDNEIIERTVYPGTERHKAIADFEAYKKSHPGIIAVKTIEKSKWER